MKINKIIMAIFVAMATITVSAGTKNIAFAAPPEDKVTICHATASTTNPYIVLSVPVNSVDGDGNGDHYAEHQGPVFSLDQPTGTVWGDIIPPVRPYHDGLNWDEIGQAIYENGCVLPPVVVEEAVIGLESGCIVVDGKGLIGITLTNQGNADGVAIVNGEEITVKAGETVSLELESGQIDVLVGEEVLYSKDMTCDDTVDPEVPPTGDGEYPAAPAPSVVTLPKTSGFAAVTVLSIGLPAALVSLSKALKRFL